jgi:hypothetical protein
MVTSHAKFTLVSILIVGLLVPTHASDCTLGPTGLPFANYIESPAHTVRLAEAAREIQPLNATGDYDPKGRVCVVLFGMSNAKRYQDPIGNLHKRDPQKAGGVKFIEAAKGGHTASEWSNAADDVWAFAQLRAAKAGCAPVQIQAIQFYMTQSYPAQFGVMTEAQLLAIVANAKALWPNLRLGYMAGLPSTRWSDDPLLSAKDRDRAPEWSVNADSHLMASAVEYAPFAVPMAFLDHWSDADIANPMTGAVEACVRKLADGVHPTTEGAIEINGKIWWATHLYGALKARAELWGALWH